jgi:hypothetical protein
MPVATSSIRPVMLKSVVYIWVRVGVLTAIWVVMASTKLAIKSCHFGPHASRMLYGSRETHVRIRVAFDIFYVALSALSFTKRPISVSYGTPELWSLGMYSDLIGLSG